MKANLLGGLHFSEQVGPLQARVVPTVDGGEAFCRVEAITGVGIVRLEHRDGTSKKWPLSEHQEAERAAVKFAKSLLKQEKKAA